MPEGPFLGPDSGNRPGNARERFLGHRPSQNHPDRFPGGVLPRIRVSSRRVFRGCQCVQIAADRPRLQVLVPHRRVLTFRPGVPLPASGRGPEIQWAGGFELLQRPELYPCQTMRYCVSVGIATLGSNTNISIICFISAHPRATIVDIQIFYGTAPQPSWTRPR